MTEGYRQRVLTALTWSASGEIAAQAIRFAFGIALARLLSPRDFGLMAMVTVVIQFVIGNADLGFEEALVQQREVSEAHRSSAFWAMLASALVLAVGLIAAAPWIAAFYGVPELSPLAAALSVLFMLRVLGSVPRAIVARRLDFRIPASRRCAAAAVAGTCAVLLAWRGFGVWSLAADLLVATAVESLLLLRASGWRPRFELHLAALRQLAGFGAYRPAARALNYWAQHMDQLLVGKLLGSNALGLYARAFNLARFPVMSVSRVVVGVLFPSLALLHDDAARLRGVYLRTTAAVALVTVPVCLGLFAAATPFVIGVLGPQWREAIPLLRILSLTGLFQSMTVLATSLYLSQGRPDLLLRLTIVQRLTMIAAILVALRWGLVGIATAQLVSAALNAVPTLFFAGRLVDLPLRTVLAHLWRVFLAGVLMAALVLAVDHLTSAELPPLGLLALEVVAGAVAYWAALRTLRVQPYHDLIDVLARATGFAKDPDPELG